MLVFKTSVVLDLLGTITVPTKTTKTKENEFRCFTVLNICFIPLFPQRKINVMKLVV